MEGELDKISWGEYIVATWKPDQELSTFVCKSYLLSFLITKILCSTQRIYPFPLGRFIVLSCVVFAVLSISILCIWLNHFGVFFAMFLHFVCSPPILYVVSIHFSAFLFLFCHTHFLRTLFKLFSMVFFWHPTLTYYTMWTDICSQPLSFLLTSFHSV